MLTTSGNRFNSSSSTVSDATAVVLDYSISSKFW